jgi:hypothetical protein
MNCKAGEDLGLGVNLFGDLSHKLFPRRARLYQSFGNSTNLISLRISEKRGRSSMFGW